MSLFFFDFRSPWALHGMSSYAIRTRLCSPNTLFGFRFCLQKCFPKSVNWVHFGIPFGLKCDICVKKNASKNASTKRCPPDSNKTLFTGREAPGEAASRAHCSNKKQLFEQQLKHCSKFLQKKKCAGFKIGVNNWMDCWIVAEKMNGLLKHVDC